MVNEENFKKWLILKLGYPVTKAYKIAADAILPFPVDEETKKLILRYEIDQKTKNTETITFKIPNPIKKELTYIAKENNMMLSQVIRSALYDFIDSYHRFERRLENEKRSREEINRQRSIQKNSSKH